MAQPSFIPQAFAENGDRNSLPTESTTAASWALGFPPITALPLSSGGIAPDRKDFNAVLYALAAHAVYGQVGGVWGYSNTQNYDTPSIVAYEGKLYFCVKENGPDSTVMSPTDDTEGEYWQNIDYGGSSVAVQMVAATPNCYRRAELMTPNKTTITVHANTQVNINGNGYISTEDVTLNLGDVLAAATRAGTDMYVYACEPDAGTEPVFVVSANSTVPDGYTADNSRKIGGFHCLCADVGTISGHTLSGYVAGDILPLSVWDLVHRAQSENEGMVWIEELGNWFDIYIASHDGEKLVSEYGGTVVSGSTGAVYMHGEKFAENFPFVKKRLIWRDEFVFFAKGSNEGTSVNGDANPGTAGGHTDTAGRRTISNYGLEDCCGVWWQWTRDLFGAKNYVYNSQSTEAIWTHGGANRSGNRYLDYYAWDDPTQTHDSANTNNTLSYSRMYADTIDGDDTNKMGDSFGVMPRFLVGGRWSFGSGCGSRSVSMRHLSAFVIATVGGRGASGPRAVCAA